MAKCPEDLYYMTEAYDDSKEDSDKTPEEDDIGTEWRNGNNNAPLITGSQLSQQQK